MAEEVKATTTTTAGATAATAQAQEKTQAQTSVAPEKEAEKSAAKVDFTPEQQELFDRSIAREFAKIKAREEKRYSQLAEAERLKGMSEDDRTKEELKLAKAKLAELEQQQLVNQFTVELTKKGLPPEFAEHIAFADADKAKAAVDFLAKYKGEVEKPLKDRIAALEEEVRNANLRGIAPKAVTAATHSQGMSSTGALLVNLYDDKKKAN